MIVKVDSEVIAEVRNALCIIQLSLDLMRKMGYLFAELDKIIEQVKRIDSLLPKVKFEG